MFGKSIIKLIGLMFAGAIALAGGAELLTSVVAVVLAFRAGNLLPLLLVCIVTVGLLRLERRPAEGTPVKMILNIVGYAATGYLAVVAFVIGLPYGLVVAGAAAIAASMIISFIGNPSPIITQVREYIPSVFGGTISGLSNRVVPTSDGSSFNVNSSHSVVVINPEHRHKVVELMRDRSLLPISLTHFEDVDVLFVSTATDHDMFDRIVSLLKSHGVETKGSFPALLAEAVQMMPLIDEQNGLGMREYRLARDEKTVQDLLTVWPPRMTVFPTEWGLMVLVPHMEVIGFNVEPLKAGYESELLLQRNYTSIREVMKSIESAT